MAPVVIVTTCKNVWSRWDIFLILSRSATVMMQRYAERFLFYSPKACSHCLSCSRAHKQGWCWFPGACNQVYPCWGMVSRALTAQLNSAPLISLSASSLQANIYQLIGLKAAPLGGSAFWRQLNMARATGYGVVRFEKQKAGLLHRLMRLE